MPGESYASPPPTDVFWHFSMIYHHDTSLSRSIYYTDHVYRVPDLWDCSKIHSKQIISPSLSVPIPWPLCRLPMAPRLTGDEGRRSMTKCERVWGYEIDRKCLWWVIFPLTPLRCFWHFGMPCGCATSHFRSIYYIHDVYMVQDEVQRPGKSCISILILHPYSFLTYHTILWMSLESLLLHNMPSPSYFAFLPLWTTVLHPDSSIYLTLMYIHYQTVGLNTIHRFFMHKWIYYGWIHLHDSCTVYCCICDWDVPYVSYKNIICMHPWDSRKK